MTGGCERCRTNVYARGLCRKCYLAAWGKSTALRCGASGCDRPCYARGFCSKCYQNARKAGLLPARSPRSTARLDPERRGLAERWVAFAFKLAGPYSARRPWNRDGFESAAMLGLVKAAGGFRPELGFKFSTYAAKAIVCELLREAGKNPGGAQAEDARLAELPSREMAPPDEAAYREGLAGHERRAAS